MVKVDVQRRSEGWFFNANDREAGPFKDLNEADLLDVAAQLSGTAGELPELKAMIEKSVEAHGRDDVVEEGRLDDEYGERVGKWAVTPKDVLKAKLLQWAVEEKPAKKKTQPTSPQSILAVCLKRRFFDVGECFAFDCPYFDWCLLQLKVIKEGGALLFYEKNPAKCSVCHRRLATELLYVKRGPKEPNSAFPVCDNCKPQIPSHWTILGVARTDE